MTRCDNSATDDGPFEVEPGPDGTFRFGGSRGNHAAPSEREQLRAEAVRQLGVQEAEATLQRLNQSSTATAK